MMKISFSEKLRYKEFAGSRAEETRGGFSSNMVSKIVSLNCSFRLEMFQLSTVKQIVFAKE